MNKIIIVDDHPVVVMAIKMTLEQHGYTIVGTANNGSDALYLIRKLEPRIVIIDIGLPQLNGIDVISRARNFNNPAKFLVLTAQPSEYFITRCIEAGASGFLSKNNDLTQLVSALNAISSGYSYFPSINKVKQSSKLNESEKIKSLTTRELMVLQHIVQGFSNKEISEQLFLSEKTISTYKTRVLKKLGANNLVDLIEISKRNGLS